MRELSKLPISITVIALNEEEDLPRCLRSVSFADEVIVMDTGSSDKTVEVARQHGARVVTAKWRGYGAQKNLAMNEARHEWVLNLDADEAVTPELRKEIEGIVKKEGAAPGYSIPRKTYYLGRWIRFGGWYPNHVVRLSRRSLSKWSEPSVHEELCVNGPVEKLKNPMLHYTFRDIADQVRTNVRYAAQGAEDLRRKGARPSFLKLLAKPAGKFLETYILKQGFRDGLPGFVISINAAHSMFMKYAFLFEEKREKNASSEP